MRSTDPIADMLSRIRNALAVNQAEFELPYSTLKDKIASLLASSGYIISAKADGEGKSKVLRIVLSDDSKASPISHIKRLSRPGRRLYISADEIPTVRHGRGMVVISTSKGVMSGQQAKDQQLGGELICEVF